MEAILEAEIDFFAGFGKIFFDRLLVDLSEETADNILAFKLKIFPSVFMESIWPIMFHEPSCMRFEESGVVIIPLVWSYNKRRKNPTEEER